VVVHVVAIAPVAVRAAIGDSPCDVLKSLQGRPVHWSAEWSVAGFACDEEEWPPRIGRGPRSPQARHQPRSDLPRRGPKCRCGLLGVCLGSVLIPFVGHVSWPSGQMAD